MGWFWQTNVDIGLGSARYPTCADVTGHQEGTFTFSVQYCLRTTLENCDKQGKERVVYTVKVIK